MDPRVFREKARSPASGRLHGVDAARAIAVAGMVMVHFGPYPVPDTLAGTLYGLTAGRASVLFALLAGVGVALLAGRRPQEKPAGTEGERKRLLLPRTARARGKLVLRGVLLLPIGLWLQQLDHGALVILQYYAVYFLLAAIVLGLPDGWLLTGAGAALVLGPVVYLLGRTAAPEWYAAAPATLGDPALKLAHNLLLSGAYPLVTWAAPLLFGIWLGRADLGAAVVRRRLLAGGAVVAVASALASTLAVAAVSGRFANGEALASLLSDAPHSQTTLWMTGSIGSACAVLGGALMLADGTGRSPRPARPLVATGQMALSVYVGHLLLLHSTGGLLDREEIATALLTVGAFMALAVAACTAWRAFLGRGPLEAVLALPWRTIEHLIIDRSAKRARRRPADRRERPDRDR